MQFSHFSPAARWIGRRLLTSCLVSGVTLASACGDGTAPTNDGSVLSRLQVTLESPTVELGSAVAARVVGTTSSGTPVDVGTPLWESGRDLTARVDGFGVVVGLALGTTTITARVQGLSASASVTVIPRIVRRVVLTPDTITLAQQASTRLVGSPRDASGDALDGRAITYVSSAPAVATITADGLVTGIAQGLTTITATCEGVTATASIVVTDQVGGVASIEILPRTDTIIVHQSLTLGAILRDAGGRVLTGRPVSWSASMTRGTGVATMSPSGVLSVSGRGVVVVEAIAEQQFATMSITVEDLLDPAIAIAFKSPLEGEEVGDSLDVLVFATGPADFASVTLAVGQIVQPLTLVLIGPFLNIPVWKTKVSMEGQPFGILTVEARAVDVLGKVGVGYTFVDRKPGRIKGGPLRPPGSK